MKCFIILSAAMALAAAHPILLQPNYAGNYGWLAPSVVSSQYHAQDELGQYSYGYAGGPSAKHEVKTWDGVTRGGYSYIDANGLVQTVNYISDPVHGFRVAATNLPLGPGQAPAPVVDTPEVVAARASHLAAHAAAKVAAPVAVQAVVAAPVAAPLPVVDTPEVAAAKAEHLAVHAAAKVAVPVAAPAQIVAAPVAVAPAQVAVAAPAIRYAPYAPAFNAYNWGAPVVSSQYHAQDELGQYSYGYAGGPSAKHETKTWDGVTRGGYSYIDANGLVQTVNYISDSVHGFRVAATNLPLGPGHAPAPVVDTPEVIAARSAHLAAHAEARARV
ncbi:cuticle protein 18.7-like [Neocloeon triangulifer]|uniref:cuticle protein 18.7-like n=1 Tax=Neocloeon triangulifer TaxID=2078957 RepID=UPI00286F0482|nr:cuticle protein 18.7-like [Neocloeon triangulifer]